MSEGTTVLFGLEGLRRLQSEWERLRNASGARSPFMTYAWVSAWVKNFAPGPDDLVLVVVDESGRCRGIAPFVRRTRRLAGVPVRVLELLGGDDSCYKGFPVEGDQLEFVRRVFAGLRGVVAWDVLICDNLPSESGWAEAIEAVARQRLMPRERHPSSLAPYLTLPRDFEEVRAAMPKKFRSNLLRRIRNLQRDGITIERYSGPAVTPKVVATARQIELRSWKGAQGIGVYEDERHLGLHRDLLATTPTDVVVDYVFLRTPTAPIAFQYGFIQGDTYFAYNTSFDQEYSAVAAGAILIDYLIRELIQQGVATFDFLIGADSYKRDWTSQAKNLDGITLFASRSPRGLAAFAARRAWRVVRRVDPLARLALRYLRRDEQS